MTLPFVTASVTLPQIAELSLGVNHPTTITIRKDLKLLRNDPMSGLAKVVPFVKRFFHNRGD